jgi:hypothetical protein
MPSGPVVSVGRGSSGPAETAGRPTGHGTGHGAAVRGHEAPAHPAFQARFAMLPAAIPAEAAVQPPEAPREARPPPPPAPPPRGPLLRDPRRGRLPGVWNAEASDARLRRLGLVRGRLDPAVGGQPLGRSAHALRLGGTTVWPRGEIWARLSQDAGAAEKAPCHFVQPPRAAQCHRRAGLPADNALRVRLKETHPRIRCRYHLPMADPAHGWLDYLGHAWQDARERPAQPPGRAHRAGLVGPRLPLPLGLASASPPSSAAPRPAAAVLSPPPAGGAPAGAAGAPDDVHAAGACGRPPGPAQAPGPPWPWRDATPGAARAPQR